MVVLDTPRLRLRPPEEADLDDYVHIHEDPEVRRYLTLQGEAAGRNAGWRIIAMLLGHWHLRGYGQWTVIEQSTGLIVGRVGLWHPEGWPGVELGWLIRRSHWNRGYATEAARTALDFAFSRTSIDHVISQIGVDNPASIRVAEKIGERLEQRAVRDDGGGEVLVYGIRRKQR